ncbi:MAG: hypothetical protein QGH51_08930 [Planctomycetota bacterium]|jgi:2-haloalkanoic acid dehalogenase type II|nr:hypothetical protein [Planctomycetota bacterium]MDP6942133.1 hypothetical protein [Planctomycetota bacterium]
MSGRPIDSFKALSFDCFGTLIDWRFGQRRVLEQFPTLRCHEEDLNRILDAREALEMKLQEGDWLPYETILEESIAQAVKDVCGETLTPIEQRAFAAGQVGWPAHPDTPDALMKLSEFAPICLLSNCDAQTLRLCAWKHFPETPIRLFVSSEEMRSYKPATLHWKALLEELEVEPHEVLHVSFSPEFDLLPARDLGFQLAWIQRGCPPESEDIHVAFRDQDLKGLCGQLCDSELEPKV